MTASWMCHSESNSAVLLCAPGKGREEQKAWGWGEELGESVMGGGLVLASRYPSQPAEVLNQQWEDKAFNLKIFLPAIKCFGFPLSAKQTVNVTGARCHVSRVKK